MFIEGGLRSNIKMGAGLGEALARATGQARTDLRTTALGIFRGLARSYEVTLDVATAAQDRRWKKWLVDNAKLRRGEVVLDIGCGTCILEERLGAVGCYFVGVDITVEMARIGISKGLKSIRGLVVADAESLPFRDGCFDAVLSCGALKYCNEVRLAAQVRGVAKPGGRVVMYDFVRPHGPLFPLLAFYIYRILRLVGRLSALARSDLAPTFRDLPRVIKEAEWDTLLPRRLQEQGIRVIDTEMPFGWVVSGLVGSRADSCDGLWGPLPYIGAKRRTKEPHEVDNSREGEGGQDCLSMANQEVHGPGSRIHIRPHGDGKRSLRKREPSLSIPPKCAGKW